MTIQRSAGSLGFVEHPNAAAFRTLYEARIDGDVSRVIEHVNEAVQWWDLGSTEPVTGRAALEQHLRDTADRYLAAEIHDVLGNDEHVVGLIHATVMIGDRETDASHAEVLHYDSNGLVVKRQVFPADIFTATEILGEQGR